MSVKPEDFTPSQREVFRTWTRIGLTEAAAIETMINDGVITLSDHDQFARAFRKTWGLSEAGAQVAADGRDGPTARRVAEVRGGSSAALQPGDNDRLISLVEQWQQDLLARGQLCIERGETRELAALREAYGKVFLAAQNDMQRLWISTVVKAHWPALATR